MLTSSRRRWLWLALCSSLLACSDDQPASVLLTVEARAPAQPAFLRLWVYDRDGRVVDGRRLPEGGTVTLPDTVVLYPPAKGGTLRMHVRGYRQNGSSAGEGTAEVTPLAGQQVNATVIVALQTLADRDGDGVPDVIDRCPDEVNPAQGPCATHDGGVDGPTDGPKPDMAKDGPQPDLLDDDGPRPDVGVDLPKPRPDVGRDAPQPDVAQPDVAQPDVAQPDVAQPDVAQPDVAQPDTMPTPDVLPTDVLPADLLGPDSSPPACALNGTYVIGSASGATFATFAAAFTKLKSCGVSGPVTFEVAAGTYTEDGFSFPKVPYASPARPVYFIANGAVELIGAHGTSNNSYVIQIENGAHDLLVEGFEINGLHTQNKIMGSYSGPILFQGGGGQSEVTLRGLYVHDFLPAAWASPNYIGGIYMQLSSPVRNIVIDGCRFHRLQPPSAFHTQGGISLRNSHRDGLYIIGCEFLDIATMDAINLRGGSFGELMIANNMFAVGANAGAVEFFSSPTLQQTGYFIYNTIIGTSSTSLGIWGSALTSAGATLIVRNNIARGQSATSTLPLVSGSLPLSAPGYNCLGYATAGYTATATDVLALPGLVDINGPVYDLHSTSASPCLNKGTPLAALDYDYDGDVRSNTAPDIGADER